MVFPENMSHVEMQYLSKAIKENFPAIANRVAILSGDMKIYVVHEEKDE